MKLDPCFPQMSDALNPALMAPLLGWLLGMPGITPGHVECYIGEKRHKPGKSLVIGYRLKSQSNKVLQSRYVTGRLCPPGAASREFELARSKRPDLAAGALTFLHEPAMLIWAFPYDRKLIHLLALLDAESIKNRLGEPDLAGDDCVQTVESDVLHYLAERSCMIRYRVLLVGSDDHRLLYAKNYADDSGRDVFAVMRQLSSQFAWGAKALAYDAETSTLWQSPVPGTTLCWADLQAAEGLALAGHIGQCVAAFHACKLDTVKRFNKDDVTEGLLATVRLSKQSRLESATRIEGLVTGLLAQATTLSKPSLATIHHDLKLNNFLVNGENLGLIDMDCVCLGDPMADLASLIANFYLHGLREGNAIEQIHPLVKQLVSAYRINSVHAVSLPALRWQVAAALIHEVTRRSLRQMDELRIAHISSYLALSESYLALSKQPTGAGDALI